MKTLFKSFVFAISLLLIIPSGHSLAGSDLEHGDISADRFEKHREKQADTKVNDSNANDIDRSQTTSVRVSESSE